MFPGKCLFTFIVVLTLVVKGKTTNQAPIPLPELPGDHFLCWYGNVARDVRRNITEACLKVNGKDGHESRKSNMLSL